MTAANSRRMTAADRVRERIRRHFEITSDTQEFLARLLKKSQPLVGKWVRDGADPRLKDLDLIADALGCTPEELVAPLEGEEGSGMWTASEREVLEKLQRSEDREMVFRVLRTLVVEREDSRRKKRGA